MRSARTAVRPVPARLESGACRPLVSALLGLP
ncbi:MAG: hypothetical protein RLZZ352_624 [Pseudomonadota bacterium]|jgi:hypothetical protein